MSAQWVLYLVCAILLFCVALGEAAYSHQLGSAYGRAVVYVAAGLFVLAFGVVH